jgi:BolA family transcriptional regulator, general stress-responsive regulator
VLIDSDYEGSLMTPARLDSQLFRTGCSYFEQVGIDPPGRPPLKLPAMQTRDVITEKLRKAFAPQSLRVEDESHRHEGHAGHRPGGETHFRLYIVSEAFRGKSRLERHRMINATLADELSGGVHALAIHAAAPDEGM